MRKTITHFVLSLVFGFVSISAGFAQTEMLTGGNMELASDWSISELNAQVSTTATWNYTTDTPSEGAGGCLNLSATVSGTDGANESQYAIYQAVSLSSDFAYDFDGAFKDISTDLRQNWCEVYIGSKPVDGEAYDGNDGTLLAQFNGWASCNGKTVNGTFKKDGCHNGLFVPKEDADFYFVVKIGNGDWGGAENIYNILLDELSLKQVTSKPLTAFSSNVQSGYAPLSVEFTDESGLATSWAWNFGDESTSTEQNPIHSYATAGVYTVTLTASNSFGDSTLSKTDYITVKDVPELPVDGKIVGGNMQDASKWNITYLNTPEGAEPTATWNYTVDIPGAGKDGALFVSSAAADNQRQFCIYQEVTLSNDKVYTFNGALKDISADLKDSWCEVFIGTKPVDGEDYGSGQLKMAAFSTWDACSHKGVDGTFQNDGCYGGSIIPDTTGTYYFVLKMGTLANNTFDILVDQLSFIESTSKPYTAFSADNLTGFAPFTVNFKDNSKMANTWAWDFGDGNTSTEQNPSNTYTTVGKYTVTLTATNQQGDSTLTKTEYITVNEPVALPGGEKLYGGNMESPDFWNITNLNAGTIPTATWNYTADAPAAGEGGNLHITATVNNTTSHYCIWQTVELNVDSAYVFEGLFKDVTGVDHFWVEVFMGTEAPADGADYGENVQKIAHFNTWEGCTGKLVDGSFSENACIDANPFLPDSSGTYYFVVKVGNTDWEGSDYSFEIMLDELSLKETTPVVLPKADFFADVTSGESPLTVQFYNQSENAIEYIWYFGDGESSTETDPSHTYTQSGAYTVSLVAKSENAQDSIAKVDLISITGIFDNQNQALKMYPNPTSGEVNIELENGASGNLYIYNLVGKVVFSKSIMALTETISLNDLPKGVYVVKLEAKNKIFSQKLIIK